MVLDGPSQEQHMYCGKQSSLEWLQCHEDHGPDGSVCMHQSSEQGPTQGHYCLEKRYFGTIVAPSKDTAWHHYEIKKEPSRDPDGSKNLVMQGVDGAEELCSLALSKYSEQTYISTIVAPSKKTARKHHGTEHEHPRDPSGSENVFIQAFDGAKELTDTARLANIPASSSLSGLFQWSYVRNGNGKAQLSTMGTLGGGMLRKGSILIGQGMMQKEFGTAVEAVIIVAEGFFTLLAGTPVLTIRWADVASSCILNTWNELGTVGEELDLNLFFWPIQNNWVPWRTWTSLAMVGDPGQLRQVALKRNQGKQRGNSGITVLILADSERARAPTMGGSHVHIWQDSDGRMPMMPHG
ncbi:hypothetical protein BDZ97DRAFT_1759406 [Flammula alnicola]|nr:hypothetical protein BDZ97DRAFT_1759406 [Flammula alnicola]